MSMRLAVLVPILLVGSGCASAPPPPPTTAGVAAVATAPAALYWNQLRLLCGRAFEGRATETNAGDSVMTRSVLRMHVRECGDSVMRIPFHVGDDRSRTWVVTRLPSGQLRLKHDHRHEDGSEDAITQYGGDTRGPGSSTRQEFFADAHTAALIPAARTNVWTMEVEAGRLFAYALRREGTDRRFRVEFDLTRSIPPPPPPWGADRDGSR